MGRKRGRSLSDDAVRYRQQQARQRDQFNARVRALDNATSRPIGEIDAGIGYVDGMPALYEQGGANGDPNRVDVYYGPNGPLGDPHGHIASNDGGLTADHLRTPDGEVVTNSSRGRASIPGRDW